MKNVANMKLLFYAIGLALFIYELGWVFDLNTKVKDLEKLNKIAEDSKEKDWDNTPKELKRRVWLLILLAYPFLGIFTFQWDIFLAFVIWHFIFIKSVSIPFKKYGSAYKAIYWVDSCVSAIWALFTVVNAYHLHITLHQLISS